MRICFFRYKSWRQVGTAAFDRWFAFFAPPAQGPAAGQTLPPPRPRQFIAGKLLFGFPPRGPAVGEPNFVCASTGRWGR